MMGMSWAKARGTALATPNRGKTKCKGMGREVNTSVYKSRPGPEGSGKGRGLSKGMNFRRLP